MTLVIRVGLQNLTEPDEDNNARGYAILLADTVLVGPNGAEVLTDKFKKEFSDVSYKLDDGEDDSSEENEGEGEEEEDSGVRKSEKYDGLAPFRNEICLFLLILSLGTLLINWWRRSIA